MKTLPRPDLEVLLGAALFPLKPLLDAEVARVGQSLAHLPKLPPQTKPPEEHLRLMIKEAEPVLYSSAAKLADAFLEAIRDRGFCSLNDLPPGDQEWFECRAVEHLDDDLVTTIEREGLPEVLQSHYARERLQETELRYLLDRQIECRLTRRAPIRDNFRAGLRAKKGIRRGRKLPWLLDAFELKPTFWGFGLNLNFIIEKLWVRLKRAR